MSVSRFALDLSLPDDGRQSEIARSVCIGARRLLGHLGFASVTEVTLGSGRRADILALGPSGDVWIVEIKSSVADFRADRKWPDYRAFSDRFFFAVPADFPLAILPADAGLILADSFGASLVREAPEHRLAGARRKSVTLLAAHEAARRLHALADPQGARGLPDGFCE